MPQPGLFITATDTEVGKTILTGGIVGCLREDGLDLGIWKPVQSGALCGQPDADSARLKALSGVPDAESAICPHSLPHAVTPDLAARLEGRELTLPALLAGRDGTAFTVFFFALTLGDAGIPDSGIGPKRNVEPASPPASHSESISTGLCRC